MNFFLFHFWHLKLMPFDSALNPASGNLTHFFQKCKLVPRKTAKLENPVKICLK